MNAGLPWTAAVVAFMSLLASVAAGQTTSSAAGARGTGLSPGSQEGGDPWSVVDPDLSRSEDRAVRRRSAEPASPVLASKGGQARRPWARTIGALAGVVGLIVLLGWGYKAISGGQMPFVGKARRPGLIEVISKTPLSARQSLCLVRVGPRLVLIGQSQETLRALDVIDDANLAAQLAGQAAGQRADSSRRAFQTSLEREASAYQESRDDFGETVTPEEQRISDVRRTVTEAIGRIRRAVAHV